MTTIIPGSPEGNAIGEVPTNRNVLRALELRVNAQRADVKRLRKLLNF